MPNKGRKLLLGHTHPTDAIDDPRPKQRSVKNSESIRKCIVMMAFVVKQNDVIANILFTQSHS